MTNISKQHNRDSSPQYFTDYCIIFILYFSSTLWQISILDNQKTQRQYGGQRQIYTLDLWVSLICNYLKHLIQIMYWQPINCSSVSVDINRVYIGLILRVFIKMSQGTLVKPLWLCRFFIKQRCEPEEGAGSNPAECGRLCQPCFSTWGEALLCVWPTGDPETRQEMHMLHIQRQGVCVLLSSGHHLDQHARVRGFSQISSICLSLFKFQYCCSALTCSDKLLKNCSTIRFCTKNCTIITNVFSHKVWFCHITVLRWFIK